MNLVDFLDAVRPLVPGVTRPTVLRLARQIVRHFAREAGVYELAFTSAALTFSDATTAALTVPADTEVDRLRFVALDGIPVPFTSPHDAVLNTRTRQGVYLSPPATLVFTYPPSGAITGLARLVPAYDTDTFPTATFSRHYETLVAGIMAAIHTMGGTAWFNPVAAQLYSAQYEAGIEVAKREADRSNVVKASGTAYGGL